MTCPIHGPLSRTTEGGPSWLTSALRLRTGAVGWGWRMRCPSPLAGGGSIPLEKRKHQAADHTGEEAKEAADLIG